MSLTSLTSSEPNGGSWLEIEPPGLPGPLTLLTGSEPNGGSWLRIEIVPKRRGFRNLGLVRGARG